MKISMISRRELIRIGCLGGLSMISGCRNQNSNPYVISSVDTLPGKLIRELPSPWEFRKIDHKYDANPYIQAISGGADLIAISDGWLGTLKAEMLKPLNIKNLIKRFDYQAIKYLSSINEEFPERILPFSVSPWVMLFRNGDAWIKEAEKSWQVLLNKELKKKVVLPNSPRVIMSIASKIDQQNALSNLRLQALTFDDRNGINWLLHGDARVVVMPLHRCVRSLRRDPRLSVFLPEQGAPLHWLLLASSSSSKEFLPHSWIENAWKTPLLGRLLASGWVPPLEKSELILSKKYIPVSYQSVVLPSQEIRNRCWSLPILNSYESNELKNLWNASTP